MCGVSLGVDFGAEHLARVTSRELTCRAQRDRKNSSSREAGARAHLHARYPTLLPGHIEAEYSCETRM